ncbi:MAG: hypothetical protein K1X55_00390 [Chitinophagales bacterium]|nr:hypothetical protein [Chitinophagales bacterium]
MKNILLFLVFLPSQLLNATDNWEQAKPYIQKLAEHYTGLVNYNTIILYEMMPVSGGANIRMDSVNVTIMGSKMMLFSSELDVYQNGKEEMRVLHPEKQIITHVFEKEDKAFVNNRSFTAELILKTYEQADSVLMTDMGNGSKRFDLYAKNLPFQNITFFVNKDDFITETIYWYKDDPYYLGQRIVYPEFRVLSDKESKFTDKETFLRMTHTEGYQFITQ